jgi:spore germination protein GerM
MSPAAATGRRRESVRVRLPVLALLLAGSVLAGACSVPTDNQAHVVPNDQVPFGLADPVTTTTAATTTTAVESSAITTTTVGPESVRLYFAQDSQFVAVPRRMARPVTLQAVVEGLAGGPHPPDEPGNLRSVVGNGDVKGVVLRAGIASVQLDAKFIELPPAEQRLAVAQLVLTLTERPGVGQVTFQVLEQPADVPLPNGRLTKAAVSRDDYASMLKQQ